MLYSPQKIGEFMGRYLKDWGKDKQAVFELYCDGVKPKEICTKLGFGIDKVRNIIRSEPFQEKHIELIDGSVEKARKLMESKLLEAATKIIHIMKTGKPDDRIKFDAAKEVLYQCGMKPVEVIDDRRREYTQEELQSSLAVVKEVRDLEVKLATDGTGFLIKRAEEPSSSLAITTTEGNTTVTSQEGYVGTGDLTEASPTGQETVPKEPVLPV